MKKTTLMLLASAALALPGVLPAMAQNTPANQPPQAQSTEQPQGQNQQPQGQNEQASNESIPASQLGRQGVRQVQEALNKAGHNVGRPDGIMGRRTREALQSFQKSKGMQADGKITQQTLADLGVQVPQPRPGSSNQQNNNQNQNHPGGNANPGGNQ